MRAVGLGLLTVAASSSFYCLWPYKIYSFLIGSGGVIGVGAVEFLRGHFASLGTFILLLAVWIVGVILLADGLMVALLRGFGFVAERMIGAVVPAWSAARQHSQVLSEIWRELSARQKPVVVDDEAEEFGEEQREEEPQSDEGINAPQQNDGDGGDEVVLRRHVNGGEEGIEQRGAQRLQPIGEIELRHRRRLSD